MLEHLGSAHSDAELSALLVSARQRMHEGQDELDVFADVGAGHPDRPVVTRQRSRVLWEALSRSYDALGFDDLADPTFKELVLARIIEPTSKAASQSVLDRLGLEHSSLRTMFRCLPRINTNNYREVVAKKCFEHASTSGDVSLVLYDVTTLYFEAEKEDELRKVGYSKERRVDPQIVLGLLVDRNGFPLEIGMFEGSNAETHTLIPLVTQFQKRHNITDIVVAGMLSLKNLTELDDVGLRFIVGSRQTKAPGDLASHVTWNGSTFNDGQVVDTITPRGTQRDVNDPGQRA